MANEAEALLSSISQVLTDLKAQNISTYRVERITSWFDAMIIVGASSKRQAQALAENTIARLRDQGVRVYSVEGLDSGEWILLDFASVIVHIMQPEVRELYRLEQLWLPQFGSSSSEFAEAPPAEAAALASASNQSQGRAGRIS